MNRALVLLSLLFLSAYSWANDCTGPTVSIPLSSLTVSQPTIYVNGTLRIDLGSSPGELVDVFIKDDAFGGLYIYPEEVVTNDKRNSLIRWIFPKEPIPPRYYLNLTLNSVGKEAIQGKTLTKINLSFRSKGRLIRAVIFVSPELSLNCRPL